MLIAPVVMCLIPRASAAAIVLDGSQDPYDLNPAGPSDVAVRQNNAINLTFPNSALTLESLSFTTNSTRTLTINNANGKRLEARTAHFNAGVSTIAINGANDVVKFLGTNDGSGGLTKAGAGRLQIAGTTTFSGGINVNGGVLELMSGDALGSNPVVLSGGSALRFMIPSAQFVNSNAPISGTGSVAIQTGSVSLFGTISVTSLAISGVLQAAELVTTAGGVNVNPGAIALFNGGLNADSLATSGGETHIGDVPSTIGTISLLGGSLEFKGNVTNPLGTTISSGRTLTLFPDNTLTFTGAITTNGGTVQAKGGITDLGTSPLTFGAGGGTIEIGPGAFFSPNTELRVGRTAGATYLLFTNSFGTLRLNDALSPTADSIGNITADDFSTTTIHTGTNHVLTTGTLLVPAGNVFASTLFIKDGPGRMVVTGNVRGTGEAAIEVNGGSAIFNNASVTNTDAITTRVNTGALLGGTGRVPGTLIIDSSGMLSPGVGPGTLRTGSLTMNSGSTFVLEVLSKTTCDRLNVTGSITLTNPTLMADVLEGATWAMNDLFFLMVNDDADPVVGTFAGLPDESVVAIGGFDFRISYDANTANGTTGTLNGGNDVALQALENVPEPGALVALASGTGMLMGRRRFRQGRR